MASSVKQKEERKKILLIEDEVIVGSDIKQILEYRGYIVSDVISTGEEALRKIEKFKPDLVLMDIKLAGDMDGIETAQNIRKKYDVPIVYLTALGDEKTFQRARQTDPFGYIYKPAEEKDLVATVETALYKHKIQKELTASERKFRLLFDMSKEAIYISDREPKILEANPVFLMSPQGEQLEFNQKAAELVGYSKEELKGVSFRDLIAKSEQKNAENKLEEIRKKKSIPVYRRTVRRKDGSTVSVEVNLSLISDSEGRPLYIQSLVRDISNKKS